jgi:hypothetical protein
MRKLEKEYAIAREAAKREPNGHLARGKRSYYEDVPDEQEGSKRAVSTFPGERSKLSIGGYGR